MTRIDLVALQQRLTQQQPKPATPVRAEPPVVEHTASASIGLAHHPGAESTPSGGHAARNDAHARGPTLESDECARGTRRGRMRCGRRSTS